MAERHIVKQGECILLLAHDGGFFTDAIWDHPENRDLKEKRKKPNILMPGDVVFIPDKKLGEHTAPTDNRHTYVLRTAKVKFTLTLLDLGKPRANLKWILKVDGMQIAQGTTDGKGTLKSAIPANARRGLLLLGDDQEEFDVRFGHVDPIGEICGVQSRLKNLGFYRGETDNVNGPLTTAAIAEFQRMAEITGEGKLTDETRQKLLEFHGS